MANYMVSIKSSLLSQTKTESQIVQTSSSATFYVTFSGPLLVGRSENLTVKPVIFSGPLLWEPESVTGN